MHLYTHRLDADEEMNWQNPYWRALYALLNTMLGQQSMEMKIVNPAQSQGKIKTSNWSQAAPD